MIHGQRPGSNYWSEASRLDSSSRSARAQLSDVLHSSSTPPGLLCRVCLLWTDALRTDCHATVIIPP